MRRGLITFVVAVACATIFWGTALSPTNVARPPLGNEPDLALPLISDYQAPVLSQRRYLLTFHRTPNRNTLAKTLGVKPEAIRVNEQVHVAMVAVATDQAAIIEQKARAVHEAIIEPDQPVKAFLTPNDPEFSSQGYLNTISAPPAWGLTQGRSSVVIAIVDTGVNGTHEDLTGKVLAGKDYVNNQDIAANTDSDDNGHGTNVASAAAAVGNNGKGIAGVDWQARILPVKVLNASGEGTTADAVDGITYAADHGADIINMSFGKSADSAALKSAVQYAKAKGVLLVAAAGNDGSATVAYPAAYDNEVIAVGAVNGSNTRASFSNYGSSLDLVAPGVSIRVATDSAASYASVSGTSIAAPLVSGALGLMKDFHSQFSNDDLKNMLLNNTDKLAAMAGQSRTDEYGNGLLDIYKVLRSVGDYDATPAGWSSSDGSFVYPAVVAGGQGTNLVITLKNTGKTTWNQDVVHLGTASPRDRVSNFLRESGTGASSGWVSPNRIKMQESSVAPGSTATFSFWEQAPAGMSPGTYRERFELVADGVSWFSRELGIYWDVTVLTTAQSYTAAPDGWSSSDGSFVYPNITRGGQGTNLIIHLKNTGKATWTQDVVHLGTAHNRDRTPLFLRESGTGAASGWVSPNRIKMQESSVAPGSTATFSFWEQAPAGMGPGTYREYFAPVTDGVTWFSEDLGIYWDVTVR